MVKSNLTDVQSAVSLFKEMSVQAKKVTLGESNIVGMKEAGQLCNCLVTVNLELATEVKHQADRVVKLAETIEARDKQDGVMLMK